MKVDLSENVDDFHQKIPHMAQTVNHKALYNDDHVVKTSHNFSMHPLLFIFLGVINQFNCIFQRYRIILLT